MESLTATVTGGLISAGWALREGPYTSVENERVSLYWKIAGAGETAPTVVLSAATLWEIAVVSLSDVDPTTPFDASSGAPGAVGTSYTVPSITTSQAGRYLAHFGFQSTSAANSLTPPAGSVERFDTSVVLGARQEDIAYADETLAGTSSGTKTWGSSATTGFAGIMAAIRAPSAAPADNTPKPATEGLFDVQLIPAGWF